MSSTNTQAQACVACEGRPSPENTPCAVCGAGQFAASAEPEQIESWPNGTYYRAWADALAAPAPVSVEPCKTCAGSGCVPHPGNAGGVVACEDCRGGTDAPVSAEPVAWRYLTPTGWHATTDASRALGIKAHHDVEPLYTTPVAAQAQQDAETRNRALVGNQGLTQQDDAIVTDQSSGKSKLNVTTIPGIEETIRRNAIAARKEPAP